MAQTQSKNIAGAVALTALMLGIFFVLTAWAQRGAEAAPFAPHLTPSGGSVTSTPSCGPAWDVVSSPNGSSGFNGLIAVEAVSANDIWAVGYYTTTGYTYHTLAQHWDGTQWSIVPSPGAGSLYSLAALSSNDVWAVGYIGYYPGPYQTLIERWDGTQWSIVPGPNPGQGGQLHGVSALSANDIWAVGSYNDKTARPQTLALHWNGTEWSVVPSPNPSSTSEFTGVAAVSPNDVWAVGGYVSARQYFPMIQHWNGTEWSIADSPTIRGYLYDVESISANDVWAVGYWVNGSVFQTLAEHWDGQTWTQVASPNPSTLFNFLYGVSAVSSTDVWAVGSGGGTLAAHWDGQAWTRIASPSVEGGGGLGGVDALSSTSAWAVGDYYSLSGTSYRTLVEHYSDPCVTATPTFFATSTPTGTPTPTHTPIPTNTPTDSPTTVPPTTCPTRTPTHTLTPAPFTPTATETPTDTVTPTDTPTATSTHTPSSHTPTGTHTFTPMPSNTPVGALYDQYDNPGTQASTSQDFETANDAFDNQIADDFVVPSGVTWNVNQVDVDGLYSVAGPADFANVYFYADNAGLPGALHASRLNVPTNPGPNAGDLGIPFTTVNLGPGVWWVSVQVRMDFTPNGQWYWTHRTVQAGNPAAWQNPGNGFATGCITWGIREVCLGSTPGEPDQMFRLSGNLGATPTPPITPSNTPTRRGTPTNTHTFTNTPCPGRGVTLNGDISAGDPTQTGRMTRTGVESTCDVPKVFPGTFNTTILRYDQYTFTNNNPGTTCFTVFTTNTCANNVFVAVYSPTYDPSNVELNYLADAGASGPQSFSFTAGAGQQFVVVVHEVADTGCVGYRLIVDGFSCAGTPPPSRTITRTRTRTFTRTATATATCPPLYRTVGRDAAPGEVGPLRKAAPGENTFQAAGQNGKQSVKAGRISSPDAPVDFILDDGSTENSIGFGNANTETAALWLNRFTPASGTFPITLKTIQILWPQQTGSEQLVGKTVRLLVYADTDGDGNPGNATRIGLITTTVGFTGTYQSYLATGITATGPGDLYIGFEDFWAEPNGFTPRLLPAAIDTTPPSQVRSWVAGMGAFTPPDITTLSNNTVLGTIESASGGTLTGNWMIRATGNDALPDPCAPSGTPTNTPTSTDTPTGGLTATFTDTPSSYTPTYTNTPTSTLTNTPCPGQIVILNGDISAGDPTQTGRMTRTGTASTCAVPKVYPGTFNTTILRYDQYTFTNNNPGSTCFLVSTTNTCANNVFVAVYSPTYDPSNIATNYLADAGASGPYFFSFTAGAGQQFVVVAHEVAPTGCVMYKVIVEGFSCSTTPLPTVSATITPTPTFTPIRTATLTVTYTRTGGLTATFTRTPSSHTPTGTPTFTPILTNTRTVCVTPTPRTPTLTPVLTSTPTATPTVCINYVFATATATIVPGTVDIGNHCDDCTTAITLPFAFTLYSVPYTSANVSSNGNLQLVTNSNAFINTCLMPDPALGPAIMPHWDDFRTDPGAGCPGAGCGIWTSVSGSAPNRIFNIEWRARYFTGAGNANFEVRLYEGSPSRFDFIYGVVDGDSTSASIGVQNGTTLFTQYSCDIGGNVPNGRMVQFVGQGCGTTTPVRTNTPISTHTPTLTLTGGRTRTFTHTHTRTPVNTNTLTVTPSVTRTGTPKSTATTTDTPIITNTPCVVSFTDVHPADYFYEAVRYLYCAGAVSGYWDGTFRPYNETTRAQLCKITVLAKGWELINPPVPHFADVPTNNPFYVYVETAYDHGIISGYSNGTFRPGSNVTRGQLCKVIVLAMGWPLLDPPMPHFADVWRGHLFYTFIETAYSHTVISGYGCGQGCLEFLPYNNAKRGQICKIVYNAVGNPNSPADCDT